MELDGRRVTADAFSRGIRAFSTLLNEVSTEFTGQAKSVDWTVSLQTRSTMISFSPEPAAVNAGKIARLLNIIHDGIESVETGSMRPPHFSDQALQSARELAELVSNVAGEVDAVRVWKDNHPHTLTMRTVKHVDSFSSRGSQDWGSVEGRLCMVSELGGFHFIVMDPLTYKPVRCRFPESLLGQVIRAFGKRVFVSGMIQYLGNGEIASVDVDEFRRFPNSKDLPGFLEIYGILGGS